MKSAAIYLLLLIVGASAHAACWVTSDGEARYKELELTGCNDDVFATCVRADSHSGRKYYEKLVARGCSGPNCQLGVLESAHFTYVLVSSSTDNTHGPVDRVYLSDRSKKVVYICSGL